tara:strand:+ start:745 stop:1431 length:687 start_codon:yes stop_codon:yes gene_type:complete
MSKKNISWCITLKNRCLPKWKHKTTGEVIELRLLDNCLQSLAKQKTQDETWEICIADWGSDDVECVKSHISNLLSGTGISLSILDLGPEATFSRGKGLNEAFALSKYDNIFFLDADMLFTGRQVIDDTYQYVETGKVYFPICLSYKDRDHKHSWSRRTGKGNVGIGKQLFTTKIGGWQEKYKWGGEDENIYHYFKDKQIRKSPDTFFHQWHPQEHIKTIEGFKDWELV